MVGEGGERKREKVFGLGDRVICVIRNRNIDWGYGMGINKNEFSWMY